jgi:hypothetical protein
VEEYEQEIIKIDIELKELEEKAEKTKKLSD